MLREPRRQRLFYWSRFSARPRPAGPGRRAAAVAAAAAGSAWRVWAGGRTRRRRLCRGDGPVYNQCRSSSRTPSSPVWPRCVATKPSGLLVSITLASRSWPPFSPHFRGYVLSLCTELLQSRGREGSWGWAGKRRAVFTSWSRDSGVGLGPRGVFSGRRRRFRKRDGQDSSVVLTSSFSGTSRTNQTAG